GRAVRRGVRGDGRCQGRPFLRQFRGVLHPMHPQGRLRGVVGDERPEQGPRQREQVCPILVGDSPARGGQTAQESRAQRHAEGGGVDDVPRPLHVDRQKVVHRGQRQRSG
ncbi:unnamed protein product, partial [Ectocarpus sp. 8 AP-2014]